MLLGVEQQVGVLVVGRRAAGQRELLRLPAVEGAQQRAQGETVATSGRQILLTGLGRMRLDEIHARLGARGLRRFVGQGAGQVGLIAVEIQTQVVGGNRWRCGGEAA